MVQFPSQKQRSFFAQVIISVFIWRDLLLMHDGIVRRHFMPSLLATDFRVLNR